MAAAASERVTPKCLVSLACPGCGSALDKTANTVDKVCQTLYCNEVCLQRDAASHALWCKKATEEGCSADATLKTINTDPLNIYQNDIRDGCQHALSLGMSDASFVGAIGKDFGKCMVLRKGEDDSLFSAEEGVFANLDKRIKDLRDRFFLPNHLIILSTKDDDRASILNGQLHLFRLDNPMWKIEEKKAV